MIKKDINYIVVQAGGKGTRLEHLTTNKPKALVPIDNRPMLFHLFEKFPEKNFIIIADYKADVMEKYLFSFANVKYLIVETEGKKGTCSGIKSAMEKIPANEAFMLIWSDLILPEDFEMPETVNNYIGISKNFKCRWSYKSGKFEEISSETNGVAGLFILEHKSILDNVPMEGELVRWFSEQNSIDWHELSLYKTKEYGILSEYQKHCREKIENRCRPFNRLIVEKNTITKEPLDSQGISLSVREKNWYKFVQKQGYKKIPKIFSYEPFKLERIQGKNIFEYELTLEEKKSILIELVKDLKHLHALKTTEADYFSIHEAYYNKTLLRLNKVRNLIPLTDNKYIYINGKKCRNIFFFYDLLNFRINKYKCPYFSVIHGDNTFSNVMLNEDMHPVFIDPRGYFGFTEIMGDPAYDWSKLYYSIVGNYDKFNLKKFRLKIEDSSVEIKIESNGWEELEALFFELLQNEIKGEDIKLIHAIIWLSLTTYAWDDYDSICGAFYNGLYYLEDVL